MWLEPRAWGTTKTGRSVLCHFEWVSGHQSAIRGMGTTIHQLSIDTCTWDHNLCSIRMHFASHICSDEGSHIFCGAGATHHSCLVNGCPNETHVLVFHFSYGASSQHVYKSEHTLTLKTIRTNMCSQSFPAHYLLCRGCSSASRVASVCSASWQESVVLDSFSRRPMAPCNIASPAKCRKRPSWIWPRRVPMS